MSYSNFVPETFVFKNVVTLKSGSEVTQGHRNWHTSIHHVEFLLKFHSNHGPISYRFRDKRQFWSKIAKFPTPVNFAPRWRSSLRNWVSALPALWSKNHNDGNTGLWKKYNDIFSHVDTIHQGNRRIPTTAKTAPYAYRNAVKKEEEEGRISRPHVRT